YWLLASAVCGLISDILCSASVGVRNLLRVGTNACVARPSVVGARPNRCDEEWPTFLPPQNPEDRQSVLYGPCSGPKGGHIRSRGIWAEIDLGPSRWHSPKYIAAFSLLG
ncbi:unnamed protein product, partial [Ectocarpus sp. 12 AP-2014]